MQKPLTIGDLARETGVKVVTVRYYERIGLLPTPVRRCHDLGIADDGERADRKQAPEVAIALLADAAELVLASTRALLGHESDPGRADRNAAGLATLATRAVASAEPPCFADTAPNPAHR